MIYMKRNVQITNHFVIEIKFEISGIKGVTHLIDGKLFFE